MGKSPADGDGRTERGVNCKVEGIKERRENVCGGDASAEVACRMKGGIAQESRACLLRCSLCCRSRALRRPAMWWSLVVKWRCRRGERTDW